ncbi:MAG TPA: hypothetical protein VEZ11_07600 [Thermoanaerobaculia bacterium]|nr:hypothetical protein [Thermoanaerobaculia bacterium]
MIQLTGNKNDLVRPNLPAPRQEPSGHSYLVVLTRGEEREAGICEAGLKVLGDQGLQSGALIGRQIALSEIGGDAMVINEAMHQEVVEHVPVVCNEAGQARGFDQPLEARPEDSPVSRLDCCLSRTSIAH